MNHAPKSKRRLVGRIVLLIFGLFLLAGCAAYVSACTAMGASATGDRLARMQKSPQWSDDHFKNVRPRVDASMGDMLGLYFDEPRPTSPETPIEPLRRVAKDYETPPASGLRVTWLGHSTMILEIDGKRVLVDPVWGEYASPFTWAGPKRWYAPPLPLDELPEIDAIVISHDHYDHLDYPTALAFVEDPRLREMKVPWFVPLGVGAHLEYWGLPTEQIVELDWWDARTVENLTITCTPSRHFSGRAMPSTKGGPTLWSGWAFTTEEHRAYYSGDTALFDELKDIGERLGPFDLTMIESGAYNQAWADVHLGPEQAVRAHELVGGKVMLPVHWGLFNLALHGWTEPIERVLAAADKKGVIALSPQPGGMVEPSAAPAVRERWWPNLPWKTAEEEPALSSGTEHLMH